MTPAAERPAWWRLADGQGIWSDILGVRTFHVRVGDGPPLLLIHGSAPGACSLVAWQRNIEPLAARGFTVHAVDQPGFGYSDDPPDDAMEFRVRHAFELVRRLDLEGCHVVGNSGGAYIAARLALDWPGCGRLVLVASATLAPHGSPQAEAQGRQHSDDLGAFTPDLEAMRRLTRTTLFRADLVDDELVRQRLEMCRGRLFEAHQRRRRAPAAEPVLDRLARLRTPTLILWGRNDAGAAVERAQLLWQRISGAELHLFDRCGHWVQWDQADRFNRIVADFLGSA